MRTRFSNITKTSLTSAIFLLISILILNTGCKKKETTPAPMAANYQQVNLVADTASFGAARIDATLLNAWGIAIRPTGAFLISTNHSGAAVIYDNNGTQLAAPLNIPLGANPNGASPTGGFTTVLLTSLFRAMVSACSFIQQRMEFSPPGMEAQVLQR